MIGGFFDGEDKALATIAERIEFEVEHNVSDYRDETLERMQLAAAILRGATDMVKRVDYLMSGDEDETTFNRLWDERFNDDDMDEQTDD
jgi:hypothetical protein